MKKDDRKGSAGLLFMFGGLSLLLWGLSFSFDPLVVIGVIMFNAGYTKSTVSRWMVKKNG